MARRSRNEGSVHRIDGRWVAVVELPQTPSGKRVRRRRRAKTKTEALRFLREMQREIEQHGTTADSRRTINDAIEWFWEARQGSERQPGTFERDTWMLSMISEGLGRKRVATLTVRDCDSFLVSVADGLERPDGKRRQPVVREHVSRTRSMLKRVLNNEIRLGYLGRNVADLAEMPPTPAISRKHVILEPAQLLALLDSASGAERALVELCGRNGLRPQEARAIEWTDIDWDEGTLDVGPQMNRDGVIVGPKTPRAPRTIELASETLRELWLWKDKQDDLRSKAGRSWVDRYDLVITTRVGTTVQGGNIKRSLRRLAKGLAIDTTIVPYDLRHTAITLQSKHAYSDWELADWAGTSERMINEVYRHRTDRVVGVRPLQLDPSARASS